MRRQWCHCGFCCHCRGVWQRHGEIQPPSVHLLWNWRPTQSRALLCCLGLFHGVRSSLGVEYHGGGGVGAQPVSCCGWTPIPVQKSLEQRTLGDDWVLMTTQNQFLIGLCRDHWVSVMLYALRRSQCSDWQMQPPPLHRSCFGS